MADNNKKTSAKVFDIAPKASASPTSKMVIVNRGPIMHDPTLVSGTNEEDDKLTPKQDEAEERLSSTKQIRIQPLDDDVKPEEDIKPQTGGEPSQTESSAPTEPAQIETDSAKEGDEARDDSRTEDKLSAKAADEPKSEAQTAAQTEVTAEEKSKSASTPTPQTSDEQKKQEAASAEAALAHSKHIADLVAAEQYYLPINQVEKRRNRKVVIIGGVVCLLLAIAWLDVALDAGLISNTYNLPHTHFFAVKS